MGVTAIANMLNSRGILSRRGNSWYTGTVLRVLRNYTYTGNLLLQTTYRKNHLAKYGQQNNGQLPKYHIEDAHEKIVSLEQFNAVQEQLRIRAEKHIHPGITPNHYPFTGKLLCTGCEKHYRRKMTKSGPTWICPTYNFKDKAACPSKRIPENILMDAAVEALEMTTFDPDAFLSKITEVRVENGNRLVFLHSDGTQTVKRWADRSRANSWTEEMKEAARSRAKEMRSNG